MTTPGLQPAPEQWLPPAPDTPAETMARALFVQLVADHVRTHGGASVDMQEPYLRTLRAIARRAVATYFEGPP